MALIIHTNWLHIWTCIRPLSHPFMWIFFFNFYKNRDGHYLLVWRWRSWGLYPRPCISRAWIQTHTMWPGSRASISNLYGIYEVSSFSGKPGVLQSMRSQSRTWLSDWTELNSFSSCKQMPVISQIKLYFRRCTVESLSIPEHFMTIRVNFESILDLLLWL